MQLNLKDYSGAVISFKKALMFAQKLTLAEWHNSYPGNDPSRANEGLSDFIKAIEENLNRAQNKVVAPGVDNYGLAVLNMFVII